MNYPNSYKSFTAAFALLFAVVSASVLTGCDSTVNEEGESTTTTTETTINNPPEEPFDASGTVSGRVMDRVTDAPIEGATVRIDLSDSLTATTGADGSFSFDGVPANTSDDGSSASGTYNVHVSTPEDSPYRDFYTAEVELVFGNVDGGSGPGNNLAASVTFELAKLNGTINGALTTTSDFSGDPIGVAGQDLILFQDDFSTSGADGDTSPSFERVRLATTTTGDNGSFSFENVEEDGTFSIELVLPDSSTTPVTGGSTALTLDPSTSGSTFGLGDVTVPGQITPNLEAEFVGFEDGLDLDSNTPEIVISFSEPIAQNDYTIPDADAVGENIAKEFVIVAEAANPKVDFIRTDDGDILFTPTWNEDFTELTLTSSESLPDGFNYTADLSAVNSAQEGFVTASFEKGFEDGDAGLADNLANVSFSIGVNESVPVAPDVVFAGNDGEQGEFNYADDSVTQNITITADDQGGLVAGYEVFVLDGNTEVGPLDEDGLPNEADLQLSIDDDASFGEITTGSIDIAALTADNDPFRGDGGSYEPIEILVRAISINEVPGETTTLEVVDNVEPSLDAAFTIAEDGGETVTVEYDEIYDVASIDASDFTIVPVVGDAPTVDAVSASAGGSTATLTLSAPLTGPAVLEVSGQTDLAGNDIAGDVEDADVETIEIDDRVPPTVTQVAAVRNGDIEVTFSEPIDPASFNRFDFRLNGVVPGSAETAENTDDTVVVLDFAEGDELPNPGDDDVLIISQSGPEDLGENLLAGDDDFESEEIVDNAPLDAEGYTVESTSEITITYAEPVDPETIDTEDYTLLDQPDDGIENAGVVSATPSDDGLTVTIEVRDNDNAFNVGAIQIANQADLAGGDIAAGEEGDFEEITP